MKQYLFALLTVMMAFVPGCAGSYEQSDTDTSWYLPRIVPGAITYQYYAPTDTISITDITDHFPMTGISTPSVIEKVEPYFPHIAVREKIQCRIVVRVKIDKDGRPLKVFILLSGVEIFNEGVEKAVLKWKFDPPRKDGQPQLFWAKLEFNFIFLDRKPKVIMPV